VGGYIGGGGSGSRREALDVGVWSTSTLIGEGAQGGRSGAPGSVWAEHR
jgi:hypothetical protein